MSAEDNINWIWIDAKMEFGFDEGWPSTSANTLDLLKAAQTDQAVFKAILEKAMVLLISFHFEFRFSLIYIYDKKDTVA